MEGRQSGSRQTSSCGRIEVHVGTSGGEDRIARLSSPAPFVVTVERSGDCHIVELPVRVGAADGIEVKRVSDQKIYNCDLSVADELPVARSVAEVPENAQ